jgi:ribosome-associated protein
VEGACHIRAVRTLQDRKNEEDKAQADDRELESRTDRRRQQDAHETMLKSVATRLVGAKPAALQRLGLDEELLAAIALAQAIRSAPARNRQVNVVRQHLRALGPELDALVRRMDAPGSARAASAPAAPPAAPAASSEVKTWSERLAESGDEALAELMQLHPDADRQQLRQRMRELSRARASAHAQSVARAEARLREVLGTWLS